MNKHVVSAAGLLLLTFPAFGQGVPADDRQQAQAAYNPSIHAADFSSVISNKFYTLNPGMKAAYQQQTAKDLLLKEIDVSGETKEVMGINTLVVQIREWLNGRLVEKAKGWVAQDRRGDVWFFGEAVEHYKDDKLVSNDGSWEAGVDGAKPEILMLGEPKAGITYRREYLRGKAEDMATVIGVGVSVTVPEGPFFQNCVHIREWSALHKGDIENKYYCVGIGTMILKEENAERMRLVTFKKGFKSPSQSMWRTAVAR